MRVCISGGSGFVGSHLVRAFDEVCAPSHAEVDVRDADAVRRSIAAYRPDAIVHAAILNDFSRLERVPYDTRLDATATAAALGVALPGVDEQLRRLERSLACTT
jgi:dTDP-4-dehydrorhamnose reductase